MEKPRAGLKLYKGLEIQESSIIIKSAKGYDLVLIGVSINGVTLLNIDLNERKEITHKLFNELFPNYIDLVISKCESATNKVADSKAKLLKEKKSIIKEVMDRCNFNNNEILNLK